MKVAVIKIKHCQLKRFLKKIRPYLKDIINNLKITSHVENSNNSSN